MSGTLDFILLGELKIHWILIARVNLVLRETYDSENVPIRVIEVTSSTICLEAATVRRSECDRKWAHEVRGCATKGMGNKAGPCGIVRSLELFSGRASKDA